MFLRLILAMAVLPLVLPVPQRTVAHSFDEHRSGAPPAGFVLASMRQPGPGSWLIRRDGANGLLVHASDPSARGLAMALAPDDAAGNVIVTARVRLAGGTRAGGLVWRYRDPANFHGALVDLVEHELVLFRVVGGNRVFLESRDGLDLDPDAWHTLKVEHDNNEIEVALGGIRVFEERDRRGNRSSDGARAGVIAAGAAEVWFDDFKVERRGRQGRP
jgi:hypothetical protein